MEVLTERLTRIGDRDALGNCLSCRLDLLAHLGFGPSRKVLALLPLQSQRASVLVTNLVNGAFTVRALCHSFQPFCSCPFGVHYTTISILLKPRCYVNTETKIEWR